MDIGGSHIASALVDLQQRCIIPGTQVRSFVNAGGAADAIMDTWINTLRKSVKGYEDHFDRIGIAMPGPFDYEQGISLIKGNHKYESLYGMNIKEALSFRLAIPAACVGFSNDAGCFLKGEVSIMDGATCNTVTGLTLGTGLGAALYKNKAAVDVNRWCMPFGEGIAEDYISTRWFVQRYFQLSGKKVKGVKELVSLHASDPAVQKIFSEFAANLGAFLVICVEEDHPDRIILGGNIAKASGYFLPQLEAYLLRHKIRVPIQLARLGENALIIGALA